MTAGPRRVAHLDATTGISGDKFLGAVIAAGEHVTDADGVPAFGTERLAELVSCFAPEATLVVEPGLSRGVSALRVRLDGAEQPHSRTAADLRARIESCDLPAAVIDRARMVLGLLAASEAHVHSMSPEEVHFHEVGGLDTVLDIVGVVAGLDALGIDELVVTPVAVGGGTVMTEHGVLPVPAPATAELLLGVPIAPGPNGRDGQPLGELTTPTGAALVRALATDFGSAPAMRPHAIGYGAGTRDLGLPNVARLIVGEIAEDRARLHPERVTLLETNLDHLAPEQSSFVIDQLLAEGALDAWLAPIVMKKARSAVLLSVLTLPDFAEETAARIADLTGTLGVRRSEIEREIADREIHEVQTPWGVACVKVGAGRIRPEHDDVARIAAEHGLPYDFVRDEIVRMATLADV